MIIIGAGIAGLLAGNIFQRATIYEAGPESQVQHKALLRFRTSAVGDATGIEFRRVNVKKGIWLDGKFVQPTIQNANWYSNKVIGQLADRSIWNIEPCVRYVAPLEFVSELAARCNVHWDVPIGAQDLAEFADVSAPVVSTIPMPAMISLVGEQNAPEFSYEPIKVRRWKVIGADVHQTVYFPTPFAALYRASITGDTLIAEYRGEPDADDDADMLWAFGLRRSDVQPFDSASQRFGKIAPINDAWRKSFIFRLSHERNIFSLGRFGTWRNILLDDVLHDIGVIKKLMAASHYDRSRAGA